MAETLETDLTTDLALDDDIPIDFEFDSDVDIELTGDVLIEIDPDIDIDEIGWPSVDFGVTTGCECWLGEVFDVKTIPYLPPDAETLVVSDPM
jgi:hypothetical protein